jgi:long-chain acyl-CoA synthetase
MNRPDSTLVADLLRHAVQRPSGIAFAVENRKVSFDDCRRLLISAAWRLKKAGVGRGDRVVICSANTPEMAMAYFAVHAIGAVAVPVHPESPDEAIRFVVDDCSPRLVLLGSRRLSLPIPTADLLSYARCDDAGGHLAVECALDDVADILYTTGTTGRKKGVVLTHLNIASAALNINKFVQNTSKDLEVVPIPLSHSFGLGRLRCWARTGNTLALEDGMRNPARVLKTVLDLKANGLALVPAGFELMLKMLGDGLGAARSHLRYIEIGSASMNPSTREKLIALLPKTRICHHYGLTEASRAMFTEFHADAHKPGTIGKPSPNVEAAICDENGWPLGPEEVGEIVIRGAMVAREYWRQPELTGKMLSQGRLRTGDLGYTDRDGYFFLVGRQSDVINVGGLKVSPEEIEAVLNQYEGIQESACVGIPDPLGVTGECVRAYLVSDREIAATRLIEWLRGRLEEYKIPRSFERIDAIPKTASGKIQRHLLRKQGAKPHA